MVPVSAHRVKEHVFDGNEAGKTKANRSTGTIS